MAALVYRQGPGGPGARVVYLEGAELGRTAAVVGFDDFELASLLTPPISVVRQDVASMGRTAAHLLFQRIGGETRATQRIHLGTTLIARGSGELPSR